MAAKKTAKAKGKRKKAGKPAARRKIAPVRKKAAKKAPARVAKKRPARKAAPAARPVRPAPAAVPAAAAPATPLPGEERVGVVTHYYGHLSVAAVLVESGTLRTGDTIHVRGHTSDFKQRVESMQIEHESVAEAGAGQEIGLRVTGHAREHDIVYKVSAALK
jgi:hypothetical protein